MASQSIGVFGLNRLAVVGFCSSPKLYRPDAFYKNIYSDLCLSAKRLLVPSEGFPCSPGYGATKRSSFSAEGCDAR